MEGRIRVLLRYYPAENHQGRNFSLNILFRADFGARVASFPIRTVGSLILKQERETYKFSPSNVENRISWSCTSTSIRLHVVVFN